MQGLLEKGNQFTENERKWEDLMNLWRQIVKTVKDGMKNKNKCWNKRKIAENRMQKTLLTNHVKVFLGKAHKDE